MGDHWGKGGREGEGTAAGRHTREMWRQVDSLWSQVSVLPTRERNAFVRAVADPDVRRELASMLEHDTDGPFLGSSVSVDPVETEDPLIGRHLGPYRVIEQIGMGGMGTVYRAERTDDAFEKEAAIKVLRDGYDAGRVSRFRDERQILARIEHPRIARLLDGGTTESGVHYVVMEYVQGLPIATYCRRRQLGVTARVRLFLQLCDAVEEAHRHLVVHRDLKPSNVLVTEEGELKLLDFGVAKLLAVDEGAARAETVTRERGLTPGYASPEQIVGGTITTASDLYSLGIMLFELLAGGRPYELGSASWEEMQRYVVTETMPLPSVAVGWPGSEWAEDRAPRIARSLRGDLDNIVAKATRVDVRERYRSVAVLARDLECYLEGRPVSARVPSWRYRLFKLVRRHPVAVPVIAALVVAILMLATYTTLLAQQALRDRNEARTQQQRAEEVARFLEETFRAPDPNAGSGEQIRARELVDRETERVLRGFPERPGLKARLLNTLGVVYQNLGQYDEARQNFERALEIRSEIFGSRHLEVSETQADLAWLLTLLGSYEEATTLVDRALATQRDQDAVSTALHATTLERRGFVLLGSGRFEAAEAAQRAALEIRQSIFGADHALVGRSWQSLAETVGHQGRSLEAIEMADRAMVSARQHDGEGGLALAEALFVRGDQRFNLGEYGRAITDYTESLSIHRRLLSGSHPSIGILLNNRARAYRRNWDLDKAERDYRAALRIVETGLRDGHRETATVSMNLAQVLREKGQFDEALALATTAETLLAQILGDEHSSVGTGAMGRAAVLRDQGRLQAASEAYASAERILMNGPQPMHWARTLAGQGSTKLEQGLIEEGGRLVARAFEVVESDNNVGAVQRVEAHWWMAKGKQMQRDWRAAASWFQRALAELPPMPEALMMRVRVERGLASSLLELGQVDEAAAVAATALEHLRVVRSTDHWQIAEVELLAMTIDAERGSSAIDTEAAIAAFARYERVRGPDSPPTRASLALLVRILESTRSAAAVVHREALRRMDARRAMQAR